MLYSQPLFTGVAFSRCLRADLRHGVRFFESERWEVARRLVDVDRSRPGFVERYHLLEEVRTVLLLVLERTPDDDVHHHAHLHEEHPLHDIP